MKIEDVIKSLSSLDFWRKQAKRFYFFTKFIYGNKDVNFKLHLPMCDLIQEDPPWIRERRLRRGKTLKTEKLILIPRKHLKTSIITKSYPLWRMCHWDYNRRPLRVLIANATYPNVVEFLKDIKDQLLHNRLLHALYPHLFPPNLERVGTWKEDYLRIPIGKYYFSLEGASYHQGKAGRHYELLIFDDLINEDNYMSEAEMQRVKSWFRHSYSLAENDAEIIVVGTRYSNSDLYEMILTEPEFKSFSVFLRQVWETTKDGEIKTDKNGNPIPIFPEKFTPADIYDLKVKHGIFFYPQYLNRTITKEYAAIKKEWIKYYKELPEGQYNWFLAADPARTDKNASDFSAIVVGAINAKGEMYVIKAIQGHWSYKQFIDQLFALSTVYPVKVVGVETENYEILEKIIREKAKEEGRWLPLRTLKSGGRNKMIRMASTLQPWFEAGKVYLHPSQEELTDQLLNFSPLTPPKHDDLIDALTYLLQIAVPPRPKEQVTPKKMPTIGQALQNMIKEKQKKRRYNIDEYYFDY